MYNFFIFTSNFFLSKCSDPVMLQSNHTQKISILVSSTKENVTQTIKCCEKRGVPKTCLGLCVFDERKGRGQRRGQGRSAVVGECMGYLKDIYDCLTGGKIPAI
jgi:hypothetical protein